MSDSEMATGLPALGDLVVVGSSAGGIEALSTLIATLSPNFPAPIVLAQHLDPQRPSALDAILQRRTSLPVVVVQAHTLLEPGTIYVVPSNHHVVIRDGHVDLQEDHERHPRPSVDLLLSSAASVYGDRLIAVILTGSGSDGAAGAVDVKSAGGTVIVQNPKTARYPSMPLALSPSIVDFQTDIEQIGPLLFELLTSECLPTLVGEAPDGLTTILDHISRQAHIDFRQYKSTTILRRIGRRMAVTHIGSMSDYARFLETHPSEVEELVKAFLINVTQFFRDTNAFDYLKEEILPQLIAQARERDRVLRFWSAGCATGEEPYSLAMLLVDLLASELPEWNIKIFATDIDEEAITFARRGLYAEHACISVPVAYRERFFDRVDHGYRIAKTLRHMVIFGRQDLSHTPPFPRIDLVLCRNVLIYFLPELQHYVLSQFAFSLHTNGYLFLGKAEKVRPNQTYYELVNKRWKLYRFTNAGSPMRIPHHYTSLPVAHSQSQAAFSNSEHWLATTGTKLASQAPQKQMMLPELLHLRNYNELLLRFLPIGVVVIDRSYHIVIANGEARRLLGLRDAREASVEQDFLHAVRGIPYSALRETIDQVFRERKTITLPEVELAQSVGGNGRVLSLSLALMQMDAGVPDLATLCVSDVTEQIQVRRQLEAMQSEQTRLTQVLSVANRRLNETNKELLDSNEELQVANEELLLTHEELQATIEEFETTNEELQATNEELETSSEELQATNEELETSNDELRASSAELHELTSALENEQVRLMELIELAPFHALVLRGPELLVEAFHPSYARRLEAQKALGQPLEEVYQCFWAGAEEGLRLARSVFQHDEVRSLPRMRLSEPEAANRVGESYVVYTMVPSHDAAGQVSGVIIYAIDETTQRSREIVEEREKLKLLLDHTTTAALALYDAQTRQLVVGNQRYLDMLSCLHEVDRDTLVGRTWHQLPFITLPEQGLDSWQQVIDSGLPMRLPEVRWNMPPDGKATIWECSLTPIMNQQQPESRYFLLVSAIEVTEHARARQEMERLSLLKDEFISFASHELRTPLTVILSNTELLQHLLSKPETGVDADWEAMLLAADTRASATQILEKIVSQAGHMNWLVHDMLDMTRLRGEVFELHITQNIDVVALLRRVVEQFATISRRAITLEIGQDSIQGDVDEERLAQALNNLISNALKYSPPTTPVTVGIMLRPAQPDRPAEALIRVQDEGMGISEEDQPHLFERFYRVQSHKQSGVTGLGLGLYIASEIIARLGGRMWVESRLGVGSVFFVALPLK